MKSLLNVVKTTLEQTKKQVFSRMDTLEATTNKDVRDIKDKHKALKNAVSALEKRALSGVKDTQKTASKDIRNLRKELLSEIKALRDSLPDEYDDSETMERLGEIASQIPKEFDASGIISDIQGLKQALEELEKRYDERIKNISVFKAGAVGGGMSREHIKDIDISASLDGSKTYQIHAVYNIISVSLSSYPYGALRKNIDYTFTNTSITFTDEIDAILLSSGQKCVITAITM
jgi:hypothetical protein